MRETLPSRAPRARYFPVEPSAVQMKAGLMRLGMDFGNGVRDGQFFQIDDQWPRYLKQRLAAPAHRHLVLVRNAEDDALHRTVQDWMRSTLAAEHGSHRAGLPPPTAVTPLEPDQSPPARLRTLLSLGEPSSPGTTKAGELSAGAIVDAYAAIASQIQEDFAILRLEDSRDTTLALFVSFPSDWRPERLLGADFSELHAPVPGFPSNAAAAASIVTSMVERGPYTRFVWSVHPDDELDHHPEEGRRIKWENASALWLRVERQVLVPFAAQHASLFLIRTYLYRHDSLTAEQRAILRLAIERTEGEVRSYKGFSPQALAFLYD